MGNPSSRGSLGAETGKDQVGFEVEELGEGPYCDGDVGCKGRVGYIVGEAGRMVSWPCGEDASEEPVVRRVSEYICKGHGV